MASPWNRYCVPYLCRLTCTVQNVCSVVNDAGNSAASRAADVVGRLADSVEEMEEEVERMVDGGDAQRMYEELRRPASQQLTLAHAAAPANDTAPSSSPASPRDRRRLRLDTDILRSWSWSGSVNLGCCRDRSIVTIY